MKFDLKKAREKATAEVAHIKDGYHRVVITQVAETGAQPAFNPEDAPKESIAVCFRNAHGVEIVKVMTLTMSAYGNLSAMLNACDDVDELEDICGQQLDIEVEGNGIALTSPQWTRSRLRRNGRAPPLPLPLQVHRMARLKSRNRMIGCFINWSSNNPNACSHYGYRNGRPAADLAGNQ